MNLLNIRMRRAAALALCLMLLLPFAPAGSAGAADEPQPKVLLLYDSLALKTPEEARIPYLQRMLAAYGVQVTLGSLDTYRQGGLQAYNRVLTVINREEIPVANPAFLADLAQFQGEYLQLGGALPAAVPHPTLAPAVTTGSAGQLETAGRLKDWLGIPREGQAYVLFKNVYPFSDLSLLERATEELYQGGVPFLLCVRPVFSHTDYPAMKRYAQALKYAQSRNGSILVQSPVVSGGTIGQDAPLKPLMEEFIRTLIGYGVAPLGLGTEMYWSYDEKLAGEGMVFFNSVVLFPDETPMYQNRMDTSRAFASSLFSVQPGFLTDLDTLTKGTLSFPMDTAVTYDFPDSLEDLDAVIRQIKGYRVIFADYKKSLHEVRTEGHSVISKNGVVSMDGSRLNLDYSPEKADTDFAYAGPNKTSFNAFFKLQNRIFIVVIAASLMLFGGFFLIGRRLYRRKFLK